MKLSDTHAFNCIVLMVKFGWTSCEDIPPALILFLKFSVSEKWCSYTFYCNDSSISSCIPDGKFQFSIGSKIFGCIERIIMQVMRVNDFAKDHYQILHNKLI